MIDYGVFQFAAPPFTDGAWFTRAASICGLRPQEKPNGNRFVVSLVLHPCRWLERCYRCTELNDLIICSIGKLANLRRGTFEEFVSDYLANAGGAISELYKSYGANSVIRCEDLPEAFTELLRSIGFMDRGRFPKAVTRRPTQPEGIQWDRRLRREVADAEYSIIEAYDYWL